MTIEEKYQEKCRTPSDIFEHLPVLRRYAEQCRTVTELGVRTIVSTWAFLAGISTPHPDPLPDRGGEGIRKLLSVDYIHPRDAGGDLDEVVKAVETSNIQFEFLQADTRTVDLVPTDLLFIDTWHVYEQLKVELERHAPQAGKFIILHDTETFGVNGETAGHDGLNRAVTEFLCTPGCPWRVRAHFKNCNGLTVLEKAETLKS